jgi:outer membrane protein insertion porin family
MAVYGSLNLLFPVPFVDDSRNLRLGMFLDAGNDYLTYNSSSVWTQGGYTSPKYPTFSNLRYSVGVALEWYSPIGPMGFSLAKPMNVQPGDQTEIFQFQLGTTF